MIVHHRNLGLLLVALTQLLSACGNAGGEDAANGTVNYPVEEVFEEFYTFLGGEERVGPALSPLIYSGQTQQQYVEAALMVYDPGAAPSERYSLAPLGTQTGQHDEPIGEPNMDDALLVEGYIVYEGFVPLYQQLGGARYVGSPLTGVRLLEGENRVEQYFENLAFTLNLDEPDAEAQLMALGRLACTADCGGPASHIVDNEELEDGAPFSSMVEALGTEFVGVRLAGPYQTADGSVEVIYENLVLKALAGADEAEAVPVLRLLGVGAEAPVAALDNPNVVFYPVQGELGYNVPTIFNDYLAVRGGVAVSGAPISEFRAQTDGSYQQCFENLCLAYSPFGEQGQVHLAPMGVGYKARFYDAAETEMLNPEAEVQMQVWEDHSQINSREEQTVHASVFAGNQLLAGIRPTLVLQLPNGAEALFQFPPTDAQGHTQVLVPAVTGQNGTLIPYEVCVMVQGDADLCVRESYMLWGNP